jgi:hypothetical protein
MLQVVGQPVPRRQRGEDDAPSISPVPAEQLKKVFPEKIGWRVMQFKDSLGP